MTNGIGIDIIEISRIENAVNSNEKFLEKLFSKKEIDYIASKKYKASTIAGMFSAKESVSKAIGTGIRGFKWIDIEISHDKLGKPIVLLNNAAKETALERGIDNIYLSISHDKGKAISVAIGEKHYDKTLEKNKNVSDMKGILIKREKNSHKGKYGKVGIIAGSKGMSGSAFLASSSALRTGSGLVYTMVPEVISEILEIKSIEAIVKSFKGSREGFNIESIEEIERECQKLDVVALGPGIGVDFERARMVSEILTRIDQAIVLDADAINCMIEDKEIIKQRKSVTILTPHLAEFARLIGEDIETIESNKEKYCMDFVKEYGVILVLKGHETLVCDKDNIYTNTTGNPGMATAGSGDVLTGVIASLLGQKLEAYKAAKLGVYLHGLAGDIAADEKGEFGLIASDILNAIPNAIKMII